MTTTITAIGIGATISAALTHMSYSAAKRLRSVHDIVPRVETPMTIYTDEAMLDLVTDLPGLSYDPGFKQFSGYLTVDEDHGRKIHYWYVESQGSPSEDPVVYWTNGGPGCSGLLAFGYEHGPYFYSQTGKLSPNPYSWNKVANMLYVEQPAGVGFSYSETETDYSMDDKKTSVDNYVLIREFLKRFPERQKNDFYVTSESYGGHYMPQLTREILDRNSDGFINFRGMVVGNPWVDPGSNMMTQFGALYSHGLVAKPWYDKFLRLCTAEDAYDPSEECEKIMDFINDNIGDEINPYGLDYPVCINHDTPAATTNESSTDLMRRLNSPSSQVIYLLKKKTRRKAGPPFLPSWDDYKPCEERNFAKYMNREDVQAALHVKKSVVWGPCNDVINELYSNEDVMTPVVNWYRDLVRDGVKGLHDLDLMVLSGDDDSICALEGTQDWIFDLGVQPKEGAGLWNPWFVKERVAGYRTEFDLGKRTNATFALVTVHGCGHEIPAYLPMEGLQVFKNYLRGKW